jgi:hypothetical protein
MPQNGVLGNDKFSDKKCRAKDAKKNERVKSLRRLRVFRATRLFVSRFALGQVPDKLRA